MVKKEERVNKNIYQILIYTFIFIHQLAKAA